jgi:hypothetical protein
MEKPKNGSLSKLNQIIAENGDPGLSGLPPSTVKGAGEGEHAQSGAKQDEAARFRRRSQSNERLRQPVVFRPTAVRNIKRVSRIER